MSVDDRSAGQVDAADICSSIVWLGHLIERFANTRLPEAGVPAGISSARANLLLAVHAAREHDGSTRMVDIALDLGVTGRTLTTMVDAMEKQGMLERVPDPDDRRAIQLELTGEGQAMVGPLAEAMASAGDVILSPLSVSEQATLSRLLTRLIERDPEG